MKLVEYQQLNAGDWIDSFTPDRYRQFARHLRPDVIHILDLGCHVGAGGQALKSEMPNARIVGVDACPEFVATLPAGIYAAAIISCANDVDVGDETFDAVLMGEFIEHLAEEDVTACIRECHRVLRPKGQLLLTTPNPGYFKLGITGKSVLGGSHLSQHKPHSLCGRLGEQGFEQIYVRGSGRMSRFLGERFPVLSAYGSYLIVAKKP
jgi:2-polyprenyl-3-methyl-5-hydroxy-6-metoxy-1,4-benzoquinol methylase